MSDARFTLRVPESWWEFDVWRATRTGDLSRRVDALVAEHPSLRPRRGVILRALREAAREAELRGALMCAVMGEDVDTTGALTAVLMVVQTTGTTGDTHPPTEALDPSGIAAQLTSVAQQPGSPYWRRVSLVEIPAGRAVRIQGVEAVTSNGRTTDCVVMHTLTPFPDRRGVLDIVLTSPQIHLVEPMLDLFDAISGTLRWTGNTGTTAAAATGI